VFSMSVLEIIFVGVVVDLIITALDISLPVCNGDIRAYICFLVVNVTARGGTTNRGTRRGAAILWVLADKQTRNYFALIRAEKWGKQPYYSPAKG